MGLKPRFKKSDIERYLMAETAKIERGVVRIMERCGEEFVTDAKNALNISSSAFPKGNYKDQTANLRSSISYFILKDDEIVKYSLLDGTLEGMSAAYDTLGQIPPKDGFRLIGVAGMDYASSLESKGYNVISSQQMILIVNLGDRLKKFAKQLSKGGIDIDFGE